MMFLTLLFISAAAAGPLLGTEQCARGPPYWCQNVKTASLCGAVAHCQQNVWSKPQMKTVPCDMCKEVVTALAQILKDSSTEAEILEYLEKACHLVPDPGVAAECKDLVDEYEPIIRNIIVGELENPGMVCGAIGLCRSQQAALALLQAKEQLPSNEIPPVDLSHQMSPFLLNVPQLLYPQEAPKQEALKEDRNVCQDCEKFLIDVQRQVKDNASYLDSLIEGFEKQCDLLGPSLSALCKEYIGQYGAPLLEQLMTMEQNPDVICAAAGFCPAMKSTPMLKLLAAKSVPAAKLFPATKIERTAEESARPIVRVREPLLCTVCKEVMAELEFRLTDNSTEEEVIQAVETVCGYLPSSYAVQCRDLIEAYGKAIIELLVQEADPKTVCTMLALCNGARRLYIPALAQTHFKVGGYCEVCKMAVNYVDVLLERNATEVQIEEAVRKACSFLPPALYTECDQLVEQYEPVMIQLILQMLDPDFVCMKLGACPAVGLQETEKCTLGPKFWCQNMDTANLCDAVAHCKRHVWE
ncbi:prosaposin isoform X3 [Brachionichthys hirsutus]|uniref:prosaposin isoform X3 n=1 Tax=Brachionichthys hirsutus TaxID=412623 RepID=UPI0036046D08